MSTYCLFVLDMVDGLDREWCTCRRLREHAVHILPELPEGTAELTARIVGERVDSRDDETQARYAPASDEPILSRHPDQEENH